MLTSNKTSNEIQTEKCPFRAVGQAPGVKSGAYIKAMSCLYEKLLSTSTQDLTPLERLCYLRVLTSYQTNSNRPIEISALKLAESLGLKGDNLKSRILKIEKKLEKNGFLKIIRREDKNGRNMRNEITPTVPDNLFEELNKLKNNDIIDVSGNGTTEYSSKESKLNYLLRTKSYAPIKYEFLKAVFNNTELSNNAKLFILSSYLLAYRNYRKNGKLVFCASTNELLKRNSFAKTTFFRVCKEIEKYPCFLQRTNKCIYSEDKTTNKCDKKVHKIVFDLEILPDLMKRCATSVSKKRVKKIHPSSSPEAPLNNKAYIIKKADNIDGKKSTISESSKSCQNNFSKENQPTEENNKELTIFSPKATLQDWGPLNQKDIDYLSLKSGKKFSINFINELLLKLNSKYPNRIFPTKNHVLSYMTKALQQELHKPYLVNHDTFKFVKHDPEAMERSRKEKFLKAIEDSTDSSPHTQLNRKIAATFCTDIAYLLLAKSKILIKSFDHPHLKNVRLYTCTLLLPCSIELNAHQKTKFHDAVSAVYGFSEITYKQFDNPQDNVPKSHSQRTPLESLDPNSLWYKVRTQLIKIYGTPIDISWFSKLSAQEDLSSKTFTLIVPNLFFSSHIKDNYGKTIQQLVQSFGFQHIEFDVKQQHPTCDTPQGEHE